MAAESDKMDVDSSAIHMDVSSPIADDTVCSEMVEAPVIAESQGQTDAVDCDCLNEDPINSVIDTETSSKITVKADGVVSDSAPTSDECKSGPSDIITPENIGKLDELTVINACTADSEANNESVVLSELTAEPTEVVVPGTCGTLKESDLEASGSSESMPPADTVVDVLVKSPKSAEESSEVAGNIRRERRLKTPVSATKQQSGDLQSDKDDTETTEDDSIEDSTDNGDPMMGHDFDEGGRLCDKNGKPFTFNRYKDHWRNQQRYERIGEAITGKVYDLLQKRCNLLKINLPLGAKDDEPHSFIFHSDGALTTTDRLLIFIHGSGVVRAGQWARRLILNDDLHKGTQIPYIERALKEGYQVMVLNTNLNYWPDCDLHAKPIPENDEPESHASYVWKNLVEQQVKAKHLAIVAHSYGGVVTTHLLEQFTEEFKKRVFAVAFTDSVHSLGFNPFSDVANFYKNNARNYVTSDLPVGEPLPSRFEFSANAERVSAGHTKHEWTSWSSMESVFQYLQEKYVARSCETPTDECCTT